jgi:hypothetical protein
MTARKSGPLYRALPCWYSLLARPRLLEKATPFSAGLANVGDDVMTKRALSPSGPVSTPAIVRSRRRSRCAFEWRAPNKVPNLAARRIGK